MKYRNQLVSIGEDESGIPLVKVWNLDKPDKAAKTPILQRSSKIQYGHKVFPVTALAVLENMTQVAIGLENGVVVLIRGDISRDRFTKSKIIHEGSEMITGLGFCEDGKSTRLYIVTLARILTCDTSNKDLKEALDDQGGEIGAVTLTAQETNQEIVIGRQEAVYFYGLYGRGPCFVIDGEKTSLSWFRNYLVVVTRESRNATAPTSALADYIGRTGNDADTIIHASPSETTPGTVLTLYDLKNKFVAFTGTFGGSGYRGQPIRAVLGEWGELFIVTEDRKMYRLQEKDMDTKLDILFKKNMYTLAINLVMSTQSLTSADATDEDPASVTNPTASSEYDFGTVVEIYKRYGDWLYSKGDYDAAIQQYLHTIGQLEPSYVIRKFLDAQRIHNLTSYLQALHEQNLANADHTTLLLNCYTKLKDIQRLDEFVKTDRELKFDVETAIRVCRQGGYHEHALWLAKKFGEHEWYMRIQLEDLKQYSETVEYLSELEPREAVRSLSRYGYILVTEKPSEMTEVLLKLCTEPLASGAEERRTAALPEDVIHLYVNRAEWCVRFLERILEKRWGVIIGGKGKGPAADTPDKVPLNSSQEAMDKDAESKRIVCNTLLELYLGAGQQSTLTVTDEVGKSYIEESAGLVAVAFSSKPAYKSCTLQNSANEQAQMDIVGETTRLRWRNDAFDLLRNPSATYDLDHALVLCKMHSFGEGILYLYERLALHKDILQQHMDAEDYSSIIATCKTYGDQDHSLWTHALAYFAEKGTGLGGPNPQEELLEVLDNIDRRNLLPPLQVIQVLARNSAVTIEMVRDYIVRRVEAEKKAIVESQKLIASYREETERMRGQIEELKTRWLLAK
ncbi:hypothetical protein SpCBS45565_g06884 [Spizellomyces sp. 'palustris']|nr:hypothetical protein SpCBS45565_g06884 [Spizellomyces sp. 'palustris']